MKRESARAPLRTQALYSISGKIYTGQAYDLSENSLSLIQESPIEIHNYIQVMFCMGLFPVFSKIPMIKLGRLTHNDIPLRLMTVKLIPLRISLQGSLFAGRFYENTGQARMIQDYTEVYIQNIKFFLGLFDVGNVTANEKIVRNIAHLLGHYRFSDLATIRSKILHDYQGLINP